MYNSILEAVRAHSREIPDKLAAADAEKTYTYRELWTALEQAAEALQNLGVGAGDALPVECTQDTRFLILDLACAKLGAVFVPIEVKASPERARSICQETGAKCMIAVTEYSMEMPIYRPEDALQTKTGVQPNGEGFAAAGSKPEKACAADNNPEKDFPGIAAKSNGGFRTAEILFTTGTTGKPKGIMISDRANIAIAENIRFGTCMQADNVELVPMPLSHSHGLRTCYANLLNGSAVALLDGVMNVALFFRLIERYHVTALDLSPTLAKLLLKIARKGLVKYGGQLDYIEIGSSYMDDELKGSLKEIFPKCRLYNSYGSTEAGRTCILDFNKIDFSGCIGYPCKNASFLIVDDERRPLESSRENPGLVAVSGPMMMEGYLGSEELTREVLQNGILYTSDLGYIDDEGRVYVLGRRDDVINYKGIKIAPDEIEMVAIQFEKILDCACIPVQDAVRGQVPKLYVVPGEDYDEEELFTFLRSRLEPSRVPVYIETIDAIPHSSNGKLQRKKLRAMEESKQKA